MQISSQDLQMVIQIIDASAEKGVFKGPDLTTVGVLRQRMVEAIQEAQKGAQANESTSTKAQ